MVKKFSKSASVYEDVARRQVKKQAVWQIYLLEGGQHRRATDPIWSLKIYRIGRTVVKAIEPILYNLLDGPLRGFVSEDLLIVPPVAQMPQ